MTTTTRLNWLAAIIIAMLLASSYRLDGPSELDAAQDIAADVADAIQTAKGTQIASTHRTQFTQAVQP